VIRPIQQISVLLAISDLIEDTGASTMEWDSVDDMNCDVRKSMDQGRVLCFGSSCYDLQTDELHRQHTLLLKIDRYRHQAIEVQNEEQANAAFVNLNIIEGVLYHLQLWTLAKADRVAEAWDQLVEAQDALRLVLRFVQEDKIRLWYQDLLVLETILFPPQRFVSDAHCFKYSECTICDRTYGECDHIAGYLYMGRLCQQRVCDIHSVDHLAIVDHPRDKGCRFTKIKINGYMWCTLTRRQLESAGDDRGNFEACILRAR
jgi:hypothetical protein